MKEVVNFLGATVLERLRRLLFVGCDAHQEECVREPPRNIA
jgi:hypothetical protein